MAAMLVVGSLLGAAAPAAASTLASSGSAMSAPTSATTLAEFGEPFHWLPPLGVESGDPTKFDASLLDGLTVSICRIEGAGCTPVTNLTSASAQSERLRIGQTSGKDSYYLANWDVSKLNLAPFTFRVTVTIARLQVGSIEVGPSTYKSFGRTWPIKFRIENNPTIRVRVLHEAGKGASQIAAALRLEFGICGDDVAQLLAEDLDPFTQKEIDLAIAGACQDAEIFPWTKIADQATGDALTAFDPATGQMTFSKSTPVLANLKANDVLVGEPAANAPAGYLRKITSISKDKKSGVITLQTSQALLNEAVKQGTLDAAADLKPADQVSVETLPGVTFSSARPAPQRGPSAGGGYALVDVGEGFDFHETVDIELKGSTSGGGVSGDGTVHIRGRVDFNAGWNIGAGVEACFEITLACVDRFEAHVGAKLYSDLHVDGEFNGHLEKEVALSTHYFSPIVFFIGPIPVVNIPIVKAIAGINGDAQITFSFDAQIQSGFEMGAKWTDPDDGGNDWQPIKTIPDPIVDGDADGDLSATMTLRAYAKADAKLLLYGIAGPGVAGQLGMEARVQYPGNPLWEIYGYIKGEVNFAVDLGGMLSLSEYRETVLDEDIRLAQSVNQPPDCSDHRTEPIVIAPGVARYLGPSDKENGSYQGYFECTDPEGDLPTYTAVDNLGNPVVLEAAKWDLPATYTVTVTARDSAGKTASFDLTVEVAEARPIVEIISASATVQAGEQYWVTASAYQAFLGADLRLVINRLPCSSIVWDVPGAEVVSYGSSRIACTAMIVYDAPGKHTITATATGPLGRQGQGILDVNVIDTPANAGPTIAQGSFNVISTDGPTFACDDDLFDCAGQQACPVFLPCPLPVPMEALLWNGAEGDYHGPLTLKLSAVDRNGNILTPTWHCLGGGFEFDVTANGDGTFTCNPFGSADSNEIRVWADVTDADGTTIHSEVRRMWMYRRVI
jgi:hypothetical protein